MYKFFFEDYFFDSLENFIKTMKQYYVGFYSNTGLFYVDKIVYEYIKTYQQLQEEILSEIGEKVSSGMQGRKIINKIGDKENCTLSIRKRSYFITFYAIKDDKNKEIYIYDLKIEKV